jgi:hypothetical protein
MERGDTTDGMEGSPYLGNESTGETAVRANTAWRNLAALADWRGAHPAGAQLAEHIGRDAAVKQSAVALRNHLHEILVDARDDPNSDAIVAEVSELVVHLDSPILTSLMHAEVEERRRTEFLDAVARRLSVKAAVRVAAAVAASVERPYPPALRQVVRRLAHRVVTVVPAAREEAETTLREQLRRLFRSWTAHRRGEVTAGFEPIVDRLERRSGGRAAPESDRIVEMAIECGALGGSVWLALQEVVEEGGTARVIDLIKAAPEDSAVASAIMKRIGTPSELRSLLTREPFDGAAVDALLRGMGIAAANVLLEELVESTQRLTRRYLIERLARFGPEIRPLVEGRLKDQRWFVQRNMLALLRAARCPADRVIGGRFLAHKDARVRREAVLWCLETPVTRDEAQVAALGDRDVAVIRPALQAARSSLPGSAVPILAKRVLDSDFPPEFRVLAINLLGRSGSTLALEALLHFAQNGRTMLGKPRLASKSQEMLAAVGALARTWSTERRAAVLLAQALKSRDRGVVAAARGTEMENAA